MKILVLPKPREGVPLEALLPHAAAEIQGVWELYAQGICREFYERAGQPGRVVLMFECASVEAAKEALHHLDYHLCWNHGVFRDHLLLDTHLAHLESLHHSD